MNRLARYLALWHSRMLVGLCITVLSLIAQADEWPQWRGPHRDGIWRETGIVEKFDEDCIEILWRQPIGPGYSGPTVADGRVYVTDRLTEPEQVERVHCFDWKSGIRLWTHSYPCTYTIGYPAGPRASVTVDDGRAYALGAMGHLSCLDASTGIVLWKKDLNREYAIEESRRMPIWGIAASPLIYDDLVVLHCGGAQGACVIALDKKWGDEQWRSLDDKAQYSAPILLKQAGRDVIVVWTGESVSGLDPSTGDVHWRFPFAVTRMPIGVATPVVDGDRLFVSSFYDGSLLLRLDSRRIAVEKVWRRRGTSERHTDSLHCMISTPVLMGEQIYGVDSYGEFRCLDARSGDRIWEDLSVTNHARWSNIHIVRNGDRFWMFNERGELLITQLSRSGLQVQSRAKLIEPTLEQLRRRGGVCWSHPAYAYRHVFARNDREIVCASLEAE